MTKRRVATHLYAADPDVPPDHNGNRPCTCGAAYRNARHNLPTMTPAARQLDARILGEETEDE